jgi:DNA-binding transcriptional LysR family regulator
MKSLRHTLPALTHLNVFESAARFLSFTRAAEELGVSQAAVSYSIRMIEESLGVELFNRNGRHLELTEIGRSFARDVALSLAHIHQAVTTIRKVNDAKIVTLSVSTAFATFWIMPRLDRFRERYPNIDLHVRTTDRDTDIADEGIELGVRYGKGTLPSYQTVALTPEVIFPVCSPAFAARHAIDTAKCDLATVARVKLIHLEEPFRDCPRWADWFHAQGYRAYAESSALSFNDYALAIHAALEGQGVVLGWRHLVEPLVERGSLLRIGPHEWSTGVTYSAVWSGKLSDNAAVVRDWLVEESRA